MSNSTTLTVRGRKFRTASSRFYIVVALRENDVDDPSGDGTYEAFGPVILKRTDSIVVARAEQRRYGSRWGAHAIVVSRVTGEEV